MVQQRFDKAPPDPATGPSHAFAKNLVATASRLQDALLEHRMLGLLDRGELPLTFVFAMCAELAYMWEDTVDRACVRATLAPRGPAKRTWMEWGVDEGGHADMLRDTIRALGGDPERWTFPQHLPMPETVSIHAVAWANALSPEPLVNVTATLLGNEGFYQRFTSRVGAALAARYGANKDALGVFKVHEEVDVEHQNKGIRLLSAVEIPPHKVRQLEWAMSLMMTLQGRWMDALVATYGSPT